MTDFSASLEITQVGIRESIGFQIATYKHLKTDFVHFLNLKALLIVFLGSISFPNLNLILYST